MAVDRHPPATPAQPASQHANEFSGITSPVAGSPAPGTQINMGHPDDADGLTHSTHSGPRGGRRSNLGGFSVAKFPSDLDALQPTWMQIMTFKKTGVQTGSNISDADFTAEPSAGVNMVCLPIPAGVGTSYGQSWDQSDMTMAQEYITNATGAVIRSGDVTMENLRQGLNANTDADISFMKDGEEMGAIEKTTALMKGALVGIGDSAQAIGLKTVGDVLGPGLQQARGQSAFNEIVVHYSGPQFRQFEFNFSMKPMSAADNRTIRRIISFFKEGSMPVLETGGGIGRVYSIPLFFKVKFMSQQGEMRHMHKMGYCALTAFNVKYGGDRFQTFAENSDPVQTDISFSLKEVNLLNRAAVEQGY